MEMRVRPLSSIISVLIITGLAIMIPLLSAQQVSGQTSLIKKTLKKVDDQVEKATPAAEDGSQASVLSPAVEPEDRQGQAGRLVFSKQPIDPNNPAGLTSSFNAGDHIYAALILNKSFREFVSDQNIRDSRKGYSVTRPGFEVDFLIDDTWSFDGRTKFVFQLDKKEGAMDFVPAENYFIFDISPEPAKARTYEYKEMYFPLLSATGRKSNRAKAGAQFYSFQLGRLGPGPHTVSVQLTGSESIKGEFTITGSNYAFYTQLADNLDSVSSGNTGMPKSEWNNPTLARSVGTAYRKQGGERVLRTVLISPSWFIQKNSLGIIIHRGLFASIATKAPDGKCYVQNEYFKQLYRGSGRYGPTAQDGRSETRQVIPCENVNK